MKTKLVCVGAAFGAVLFAGCTFPSRGTLVDRNRVGRSMSVDTGDIIAVREVVVSGQPSAIGVSGGGLVGYASAAGVGQGTGTLVARAAGAVVGAVAGSAVEEAATRRTAQEIQVKMGNGDVVAVVQEIKDGQFAVGEHVQVLQGGAGMVVRRF